MVDVLNRIQCDMVRGGWLVLYKGRRIAKNFKTSAEAIQHLDKLKGGHEQPVYA